MGLPDIRDFMHAHCRFRLRSGREVFGVIWEAGTQAGRLLHFASIGEYERARRDARQPSDVIPMQPEDILLVERLSN